MGGGGGVFGGVTELYSVTAVLVMHDAHKLKQQTKQINIQNKLATSTTRDGTWNKRD